MNRTNLPDGNVDSLNSNLQGPWIQIHSHINTLHIYIKTRPHDCQYDHLSIIAPGSML